MLLLEAILAIVILTTSLAVIIESLVSGLRATVFTADYSKAVILTDNVMSQILLKRAVDPSFPKESEASGSDEPFHYQLKTEKITNETTQSSVQEVQLRMAWKSGPKEQD